MCPRTGEITGLEVSGCDTAVMQAFLDEANKDLHFTRLTNYLVLDNASWHKAKGLRGGKFTPLYLPPYRPDFNPIEHAFSKLKAALRTSAARTPEALDAAIHDALPTVTAADAAGWFAHCGYGHVRQ